MKRDERIERLHDILTRSSRAVFFGGAGLSTESGIPDFRSENGIYRAKSEYGFPPETLLSHSFFVSCPETFFDYYRKNLIYPDAKPNKAHRALARLERDGHLAAVVTQNIDGLHQSAGSRAVFELHGSVHRNACMRCGKKYPLEAVTCCEGVPRCACGGIIKPDVVLYEEGLDEETLYGSVRAISDADTLIVGGTSLTVYPAAGLLDYFRGNTLVVINLQPTPGDRRADLVIHEKIGEVLDAAWPEAARD